MDLPHTDGSSQQPRQPLESDLHAYIDRCRRAVARQTTVARLVVLLSLGSVVPLLAVVADHNLAGGLPGRVPAMLGRLWSALLASGLVVVAVLSLVRRPSRVYAARLLEKLAGVPHNMLVNAVLLENERAAAYAYGPAARQALAEVAGRLPARWSEPGGLRKPAAVATAVAAGWLLYAAVCPKPIWPSLARFFGWQVSAPTATSLALVRPPPGEPVLAGEPLEVEFAVSGRQADRVSFEVLRPEAPEQVVARIDCHAAPDGLWLVGLAPHEVSRDIWFRCTANDAVLRGIIPVVPQPAVVEIEADIEPPEYTGFPARTVTGGDLEVIEGTRVTLRFRANAPVRDAVFVWREPIEARTRMTVDDGNPTVMSVRLTCTESGSYRVEFVDRWGHPAREVPEYRLTVRPDSPPTVEITEPPEQPADTVPLDAGKALRLVACARDDVRIAEMSLVCEHAGIKKRIRLDAATDAEGRQAAAQTDLSALALEPGKPATVWVEAVDNRVLPDGRASPQVGRSRRLTIIRPLVVARRSVGETPLGKGAGEIGAGDSGSEKGASAGGSQHNAGAGADGGAQEKATSQPAGAESGNAQGQDPADLERELEDFLEKHGQEAKEAGSRLCGQPRAQPASQPTDAQSGQSGPGGSEESPDSPTSTDGSSAGPAPADDRPHQNGASEAGQPAGPDAGRPESPDYQADGSPPEGPAEAGQRRDLGPAEAPIGGHEPSSAQPALEPDGLAETVDLLELVSRGEKLEQALLDELGWPADKAGAFVKALERLHDAARQAGLADSLHLLRFSYRPGSREVKAGAGLSQQVSTQVETSDSREPAAGRIRPAPDQVVPPHLRAILEAYYRALAQPDTSAMSGPATR